eukprot:m.201523 g.201523  ORF g.201523 m.201523 type:complete len:1025 (-) comp32798_c0_seq3:171-3245(-)
MATQRVFCTWAQTNGAACKYCHRKFNKGELKVVLCSPSTFHAGHDMTNVHLQCGIRQIKAFCSKRRELPEFYHKMTCDELLGLCAICPSLLPSTDHFQAHAVVDKAMVEFRLAIMNDLGPKLLKEILVLNGKYIDDGYKLPKLAQHVADGVMWGKLGSCPACKNIALSENHALSEVYCDGNLNGYDRCTYHASSASMQRTKAWVLPKSCRKKQCFIAFVRPPSVAAFDVEYEGPPPKEPKAKKVKVSVPLPQQHQQQDCVNTPVAKKRKLDSSSPLHTSAQGPPHLATPCTSIPPQFSTSAASIKGRELCNLVFFLAGRFKGGRPNVIRQITVLGGSVVAQITKATHILVRNASALTNSVQTAISSGPHLPVVNEDFLERILTEGETLRTAQGLLASGLLLFDSPAGKDVAAPTHGNPQLYANNSTSTSNVTPQSHGPSSKVTPKSLQTSPMVSLTASSYSAPASTAIVSTSTAVGRANPNAGIVVNTSSTHSKSRVSAQQLIVDPECGYGGNIVVSNDNARAYSVVLNQVTADTSKYYKMQLIETNRQWVIFAKWGNVDQQAINVNARKFDTKEEAVKQFEKKFKEATGNKFEDLDSFKKKPYKYDMVDLREEAAPTSQFSPPPVFSPSRQRAISGGVSPSEIIRRTSGGVATSDVVVANTGAWKMPTALESLIRCIFDANHMTKSMDSLGLSTAKLPLGKISMKTVREGYATLSQIATTLRDETDPQVLAIQIKALSRQFYSQFPCEIECAQDISSQGRLQKKIKMVDELMNMEACRDMLSGASLMGSPHTQYLSLGVNLIPLSQADPAFKLVTTYAARTHGETHSFRVQVNNVFKVQHNTLSNNFESTSSDISNKQLLWHGSRLSNWTGILSQGLRIAPPEAPVSGYMFGKGLYFANAVSKSVGYCAIHEMGNGRALLLLCEVALGASDERLHADSSIEAAKPPFHSTHGVGKRTPCTHQFQKLEPGLTVPSGVLKHLPPDNKYSGRAVLEYDEFIVYNVAQQRPRFLVECTITDDSMRLY